MEKKCEYEAEENGMKKTRKTMRGTEKEIMSKDGLEKGNNAKMKKKRRLKRKGVHQKTSKGEFQDMLTK